MLQKFETKQALMDAYRNEQSVLQGVSGMAAKLTAIERCKYVPHLYRGGCVIPRFGYSAERIGRFIERDRAGDPEAVR